MRKATAGDNVQVHYTGTLDDGSVFDSSRGREPLEFTIGSGRVIAGFDTAISGMAPGEAKTVTIPVDEAYGPRRDDLRFTIQREQLPESIDPRVGEQLQMSQDGQVALVTVAEVSDDAVMLDANHPLAGRDLTFELELVEIR
jgi:peptidylprolyl isomerase